MAAAQIYIPGAMPSFARNGDTTLARLYFYENETTTPKTVYTTSALTVAHAFPVVSSDIGAFPEIWADSAQEFSVTWTTDEADPQSRTLNDIAPGIAVTLGQAATIDVGTTTTLTPGSSATVANSGTSSAAVFNFGIPAGLAATATAGTTTTGPPGSSASVANSGTTAAAIFDFTIPRGDVGPAPSLTIGTVTSGASAAATITGTNPDYVLGLTLPAGDAATIAVGTVTTGAAGTSATVTNVGTTSAAVFNFVIPQGTAGTGAGNVNPTGTIAANDIAVFTDTSGNLIQAGTPSTMRTTLGLVIGTNVQAQDAELQAIAGLTSAADRLPYFTGSGTAALATFTTFARSLVDDADASTARTTLGLGTVATLSTITLTTNVTGTLPVANGGTGAATLTANNVLLGNGTSAVQVVAPSTSGNVLTSNGTTWVSSPGASAMVLLSTLTASSSASLSNTTSFTSAYDAYQIVFDSILPANSGGSTFRVDLTHNGGGAWATFAEVTPVGTATAVTISDTQVGLTGSTILSNPNGTANGRVLIGAMNASNGTTNGILAMNGKYTASTSAVNGLRFQFATGNIASGKIYIYGMKTS